MRCGQKDGRGRSRMKTADDMLDRVSDGRGHGRLGHSLHAETKCPEGTGRPYFLQLRAHVELACMHEGCSWLALIDGSPDGLLAFILCLP